MSTAFFISDTGPLNSPELFADCYGTLPPERQRKIDALRFEKDRRLSLGAGVLLQEACRCFSVEGADRSLRYNERGKPFFRDYPDVFFNLSHSGQRVMCVISHLEAGCDAEQIKAVPFPVVKRVFTGEERELLFKEDQREYQESVFCRLWTLKESFLKAIGTGFAVSPDSFSVTEVCGEKTETEILGRKCRFLLPDLGDGYRYACCLVGGDGKEQVRGWEYGFDRPSGEKKHPLQLSGG